MHLRRVRDAPAAALAIGPRVEGGASGRRRRRGLTREDPIFLILFQNLQRKYKNSCFLQYLQHNSPHNRILLVIFKRSCGEFRCRLQSLVDPAWKEALLAVDVAAVSSTPTPSTLHLSDQPDSNPHPAFFIQYLQRNSPHNWVLSVILKHLRSIFRCQILKEGCAPCSCGCTRYWTPRGRRRCWPSTSPRSQMHFGFSFRANAF